MRAGKTCVNGTRGLHPRRSPQGRSKLAVEELLPRGQEAGGQCPRRALPE